MSKFSTLIAIRKCFTSTHTCNDKETVLKLADYLLDNNHGSTIISGIFRELYWEGENNSDEFLNDLLKYCTQITQNDKNHNKEKFKNNGTFDVLPDSLLCHIGSYLTSREIFGKWDLINRKFLETGLKPEILTQWNFNGDDDTNYCQINSCKFSVAPLLKQIEFFDMNESTVELAEEIHIESMKSLKTVEIEYNEGVELDCVLWVTNKMPFKFDTLSMRDTVINTHCEGFDRLKRIDLINCCVSYNEMDCCDIDNFLQLIIPLSPKEIELRKRLKTEISKEMKAAKQSWEIEKLEKQINNEINEKYDRKFDENELNAVGKDESKQNLKYQWNSQLEMLSLVDFDLREQEPDPNSSDQLWKYCTSQLNQKRIKETLINLQGLCLHGTIDWNYPTIGPLSTALLNTLGNKLRSLHIDDGTFGSLEKHWLFMKNNYPWASESTLESWHPSNVQELCLSKSPDASNRHFWVKINRRMFPKLKHLKIIDEVDDNFDEKCFGNGEKKGLVKNGLESFQLKLTGLDCRDFDLESHIATNTDRHKRFPIKNILKSVGDMFSISTEREWTKRSIIVKIEFEIDIPDGSNGNVSFHIPNGLKNISTQLLLIYSWLVKRYDRVMFGFKLSFLAHEDDSSYDCRVLLNAITIYVNELFVENIIFQNDHGRVVEKSITSKDREMVVFAAMFKSRNKAETNISCPFSHMEPKFKYHCQNCRATPWGPPQCKLVKWGCSS